MSDLTLLVAVADEVEAEMVRSLLESNGIISVMKAPAYTFPTSPIMREIFVKEEDLELAQKILSSAGTISE